jgi:hypothetical protein
LGTSPVFTSETVYIRVVATFIAFGIVGIGITESIRATNHRENSLRNPEDQGTKKPDIQQSTQGAQSPAIVGDGNTINYSDPQVKERLEAIEKAIKAQNPRFNEDALLKKYPLGYVIFDVDRTNQVTPYKAKDILEKYEVDWGSVGIQAGGGRVTLRLPSLKAKDGTVAFTNAMTGGPLRVGNLGGASANGLTAWGEILAINNNDIVFLVGFEQLMHIRAPH